MDFIKSILGVNYISTFNRYCILAWAGFFEWGRTPPPTPRSLPRLIVSVSYTLLPHDWVVIINFSLIRQLLRTCKGRRVSILAYIVWMNQTCWATATPGLTLELTLLGDIQHPGLTNQAVGIVLWWRKGSTITGIHMTVIALLRLSAKSSIQVWSKTCKARLPTTQ